MKNFSLKLSPILLMALASLVLLLTRPGVIQAHSTSPATPPDMTPAAPGEILVVIANFQTLSPGAPQPADDFMAGLRTMAAIQLQPIRIVRTSSVLTDAEQARVLSDAVNATMVIWGHDGTHTRDIYFEVTPRDGIAGIDVPVNELHYQAESVQALRGLALGAWASEPMFMVHYVVGQILLQHDEDEKALLVFENVGAFMAALSPERQRELHLQQACFYAGTLSDFPARKLYFYSKMLELDPLTNQYDLALADYVRSMAGDANAWTTARSQGTPDVLNGQYGRAIFEMEASIQSNPRDTYAMLVSADAWLQLGNIDKSAKTYMRYINNMRTSAVSEPMLALYTPRTVEMTPGHVAYIPFEGFSGQHVALQADSTDVDSLIVLLDPSGLPVAASDDIVLTQNLNARIDDFILPATGTYTLLVTHSNARMQGNVTVTVQSP